MGKDLKGKNLGKMFDVVSDYRYIFVSRNYVFYRIEDKYILFWEIVDKKRSKEMKNIKKNELYQLKDFLILWSTQSVSQLGSSITAFALTLWLYEKTGSSLSTATLTMMIKYTVHSLQQ